MQFANNENGTRVHINDADPNVTYFCPYCEAPMTQKTRGNHKIPHFSHRKGHLCSDSWHYEPMTDWHMSLQLQYPLENREVSIINELGRHRADILINNTVVEFQHSPISDEEFKARNDFYTACGYRVIWLFDARSVFGTNLTKASPIRYQWKYPPKMLTGFNLYGNVHVYFHIQDHENGTIMRLTECKNGYLGTFGVAPSEYYTESEFVELTYRGFLLKENDTKEKERLHHTLYFIRRTNGEKECYGCPISSDGYAPRIREQNRITCEECPYCKGESYDPHTVVCTGRYREYLETMVRVLSQNDSFVPNNKSITYIDTDGNIQQADIDPAPNPANTIIELAKQYSSKVMIVTNIRNGKKYKVSGNADYLTQQSQKYKGNIYGDFYNRDHWSLKSDVIYYSHIPVWIVEWFLPQNDN